MPSRAVDHLVVAAATLDEGVRWCEHAGRGRPARRPASADGHAQPAAEDRHAGLPAGLPGDHRHRPRGAAPGCGRALVRAGRAGAAGRLAAARLVHWVARTPALDMHRASLPRWACSRASRWPPAATRRSGLLQWQILVRADGRCCAAAPAHADPVAGPHPAARCPTAAWPCCRLVMQRLPAGGARQVLRPARRDGALSRRARARRCARCPAPRPLGDVRPWMAP
jgi:hypothetical protein